MEWKKVKLGEVCDRVCSGGTPNSRNNKYYDGGIPWLNTKEINFGRIYSTERTISQEGLENSSAKWIDENSVIVAMYGATAGKVAVSKIRLTTNQACCNLHIDEKKADYNYVYYYLLNNFSILASLANGGAQQNLNAQIIKDFLIPLPPLETQRRIAAILSSLDDKIENNNRINRNLEAQAQALFKSWFVDFEPWGGIMPEDWKEGVLGEIVTVKRGGSPRPIQDYLSDKGYRWLKISDATAEASPFISHIVEHIKEEGLNKTVFIKQGSLVLSNSATPGLPKFVDLDTCIHDGWLYFPQSYFSNEYLYLLFQRERSYLLSQGNGSVFTNLKTDIVKNLCVTIPAEDVLNSFQKIIGKVFMEILNNQRENSRLAALRDTLLPKLMKGEIEV